IDENIALSSTQLNVADNIQDLQFQYGIDTGTDGQIDSWVDNPTDITQIRAIRVFILARTGKIDKEYTDTKTYTLAGGTVGPFTGTDSANLNTYKHVHRYLLESTITVRNRNF
ncbi:MAG: PilW family protein, partial [Pseudomonadota bacterium]|nr:PilW family protein [Pseudomonadota bacterium]